MNHVLNGGGSTPAAMVEFRKDYFIRLAVRSISTAFDYVMFDEAFFILERS